jgi:ketosteroid isomerase-like protein
MKKLSILCPILLFAACTTQAPKGGMSPAETDKAFCKMALEKGYGPAFVQYADTNVVEFGDGTQPIQGIEAFRKSKSTVPGPDKLQLSWEVTKEEVAASGDLAYTWGHWKMHTAKPDTTYYGVYVTVWKKQADGSWKYVLDGGNNTPKP